MENNLIDFKSEEGEKLLKESEELHTSQYELFRPFFCKQKRNTFCGVCSASMVFNMLLQEPKFQEEKFFEDPIAKKVLKPKIVEMNGITLSELFKLFSNWETPKLQAIQRISSQSSLEEFRSDVIKTMSDPSKAMIVNYHMEVLGQGSNLAGHISPLAAYHASSDRVLLLDVWHYGSTDPVSFHGVAWVPLQKLFKATNTIDFDSKLHRGWILIERS